MKVIKQIPNFLTLMNLLTGVAGIVHIFSGDYTNAILFVLLAAGFDFLDGFAARLLGATGDFGKELDSLADMVSFGVLPALYWFQYIKVQNFSESAPYIALVIAAFSAVRLAKFNIDTRQTDGFIGLPTPANAIMITTLGQAIAFHQWGLWAMSLVAVVSALLLVSPIRLIALKFKSFGWKHNESRYLLLIAIITLIVWLKISALQWIIPTYLLISMLSLIKRETN